MKLPTFVPSLTCLFYGRDQRTRVQTNLQGRVQNNILLLYRYEITFSSEVNTYSRKVEVLLMRLGNILKNRYIFKMMEQLGNTAKDTGTQT
jgi:hypothetical protein